MEPGVTVEPLVIARVDEAADLWREADHAIERSRDEAARSIAVTGWVRAMLVRASAVTIAQRLTAPLIGALLDEGLINAAEATAIASLHEAPIATTASLVRIAPRLGIAEARRAIAIAIDRAQDAIAPVAARLAALGEGDVALAHIDELPAETRADALTALVEGLEGDLRAQAIEGAAEAARTIDFSSPFAKPKDPSLPRAGALLRLAAALPSADRAPLVSEAKALAEAYYAEHRREKRTWMAALLARVGDDRGALAIAKAAHNDFERADALAKIAPHVGDALRAEVVTAWLDALRRFQGLGPLPMPLPLPRSSIVRVIAAFDGRPLLDRAWALLSIAAHHPEVAPRAWEAIAALPADQRMHAGLVLAASAPRGDTIDLSEITAWVRALVRSRARSELPLGRARVLSAPDAAGMLAPLLDAPARIALLREALAVARSIGDDDARAFAIDGLGAAIHAPPSDAAGAPGDALAALREALASLSHRPRADALHDLANEAAVIATAGGLDALRGALGAIDDIGRRSP